MVACSQTSREDILQTFCSVFKGIKTFASFHNVLGKEVHFEDPHATQQRPPHDPFKRNTKTSSLPTEDKVAELCKRSR